MDLAGVTFKDHATLARDRMCPKLTDCYKFRLRARSICLTDGIRILDKSRYSQFEFIHFMTNIRHLFYKLFSRYPG